MIKIIYKYPLLHADLQAIEMPRGAQVLTVQEQFGELRLWALVDPTEPTVERAIRMAGTGHPIDAGHVGRYISTVQQGSFVWHFFEMGAL